MSGLPEELERRPRERPAWVSSPIGYRLRLALLAAGGLVLMAMGYDSFKLRSAGLGPAAGTGRVTYADTYRGSKGSRHGRLTYSDGAGKSYRCDIDPASVPLYSGGDTFPVFEVPRLLWTDTLLEPCAAYKRRSALVLCALFVGIGLVVGGMASFIYRSERRRYRLLCDGLPAIGTLTALRRRSGKGGPRYELEYRLDEPVAATGKRTIPDRKFRIMAGDHAPAVGDKVYVLYERDRPEHIEIWGFVP